MIRTYRELSRLDTFDERFKYLQLRGAVGEATFGYDRYLNQMFYSSREWRQVRHHVIARDNGCDLGIEGYDIFTGLYIHHMNPLCIEDITHGDVDALLNPDFLITTTHRTHNAIHYGDVKNLVTAFTERREGDTQLW